MIENDKEADFHIFPNEIWFKIFSFLDLKTQKIITRVNKDFLALVGLIWKTKLMRLKPLLGEITADYRSVKLKVVMNAFLTEKIVPVEQFTSADLYETLSKYEALSSSKVQTVCDHEYAFFHDYDKAGCKFLDLYQKWPRPGSKSLDKFIRGNKDLVYLDIADCRENIEAVHFLTTQCTKLEALRMLATDPLIPYAEILKLKQLKFLEIQFDSFYRDHRDDLIYSLNQLPLLQVLKFQSCYGMTDQHVVTLLERCKNLSILQLPFNTKINGWFLESVLEKMKSPDTNEDIIPKNLTSLKIYINTAYVELSTVIPELYVRTIQDELKILGLDLHIEYVHKKLSSFNPKDFYV